MGWKKASQKTLQAKSGEGLIERGKLMSSKVNSSGSEGKQRKKPPTEERNRVRDGGRSEGKRKNKQGKGAYNERRKSRVQKRLERVCAMNTACKKLQASLGRVRGWENS